MPSLVVQMGHTGRPPNPGSRGTAGEQDFSRAVGEACVRQLHGRGGWTVRLVIADPPAGSYRGDAFVAIHADGSTNAAVRGGSIGYQTPEGARFASAWKAAYQRRGFTGGWQRDNYTDDLHYYYGVRAAVAAGNRRAFIAECGHLTSPADRELLLGPGGYDRVALAIGDALGIPTDASPQEDDMAIADIEQSFNRTIEAAKREGAQLPDNLDLGRALAELYVVNSEAFTVSGGKSIGRLVAELAARSTDVDAVKAAAKAGTTEALAEGTVDVDVDVTIAGGSDGQGS